MAGSNPFFQHPMENKTILPDCLSFLVLEVRYTTLYAEALKDKIYEIGHRFCYGSMKEYLSQTQHNCTDLIRRLTVILQ